MSFLPKEKSQKETSLDRQITLVYGRPKIGKSTFCSCFNQAIFLATEPGLNHLEVFKTNITSWKQFMATCKELKEGNHKFKTIIIDTIDRLIPLCQEYYEKELGVEYIGDVPHGKGWSIVTSELGRVLTKLASLPYGLVLVSHSKQEEIETKTKKYNRFTIDIGGKNQNVILYMMDIILFMDSDIRDGEEIGLVRTKPSLYWEAGDKSKLLPDNIEYPLGNPEVAFKKVKEIFD